jgi:hypothetical protein
MHYSLEKFQKDFLASLGDHKPSKKFLQQVMPSIKMGDKKKPIKVYKDGYRARLTEALGETFEACWWVLGDEEFFSVCSSFIRAHPSLHYNLSEYGREFPEFLYNHEVRGEIPFVFDLAHFEWSFKELFHCKQHKGIDPSKILSHKNPSDMKFEFGAACFLFHSKYSIYDLWQKRKDEQNNCSLDLNKEDSLVLYKQNNRIFVDKLSKKEFLLLKYLKQGYSLEQALDSYNDSVDEQDISLIFQNLMSRGLLVAVDFFQR